VLLLQVGSSLIKHASSQTGCYVTSIRP